MQNQGRPTEMVQDWPRDAPSRHASFHQQPRYQEDYAEHRRYQPESDTVRPAPPMSIDVALHKAGIWAKQYFVAAIMPDGTPTTFFSPGQQLHDSIVQQFFDIQRFQQVASNLQELPLHPKGDPSRLRDDPYSRSSSSSHRQHARTYSSGHPGSLDGEDEGYYRQTRKRPRYPIDLDDDAPPPSMMTRRSIKLNDKRGLWKFYDQRFKQCQQTACKLIAKAWVKAVEPKKQSTHPYTGSDEKAPDWWPKPWGDTKEDKVRHKEPDHLYKRERVHLLNHILAMVVETNEHQHPDIRKVGLNVKKLEECTNEALSGFYAESEAHAAKKQYLGELFRVARQQERFKHGEIDGDTQVMVLNNHRIFDPRNPENAEGVFGHEDDDGKLSPSTRSTATQGFSNNSTTSQSPATAPPGAAFLGDLPMRNQQIGSTHMVADMGAPQSQHGQSYVDEGHLVNATPNVTTSGPGGLGVDILPSPHELSRRAPTFTDYSNVQGNSMYAQSWAPGTTAPSAHGIYAPQSAHPQTFMAPGISTAQQQQQPPYIPSVVERLPAQGYDATQAPIFRGDIQQPQVNQQHQQQQQQQQQQGYTYMTNDGRSMGALPGLSEVTDPMARGHM